MDVWAVGQDLGEAAVEVKCVVAGGRINGLLQAVAQAVIGEAVIVAALCHGGHSICEVVGIRADPIAE